MSKRVLKIVLGILIILILAAAIYFTFFFYYSCKDLACYKGHQEKCVKTKFINEQQDGNWLYRIQGKSQGKCNIEVTLLTLKEGSPDNLALEGKSMSCLISLGVLTNPESDLSNCHGVLKEEMQNMIIQKLHKYILDNLGKIDEGLNQAI